LTFSRSDSSFRAAVIAAIQTFGDRINLHMHLHFLVTEGGTDEVDVFHKIPRIDDALPSASECRGAPPRPSSAVVAPEGFFRHVHPFD